MHTFDGAQGTDLACLLRRLKSRLGIQPGYLWDYKKAAKGQKTNSVKVSFEKILDFRTDPVLKIETLQEIFPEQKWNPQSSGIEIKDEYTGALKALWDELIGKQKSGDIDEILHVLSQYTSEKRSNNVNGHRNQIKILE